MRAPRSLIDEPPADTAPISAPSLTDDIFVRLYPWMTVGDARVYAAIDHHLARMINVFPGPAGTAVRHVANRQWTPKPTASAHCRILSLKERLYAREHYDDGARDVALDIYSSCVAWSGEGVNDALIASPDGGRQPSRLVLSVSPDVRWTISCALEPIKDLEGAVDAPARCTPNGPDADNNARLSTLCYDLTWQGAEIALAIDRGLAATRHRWTHANNMGPCSRSPIELAAVGAHVRHIAAEAHRCGVRYGARPGCVVLAIVDQVGVQGDVMLLYAVERQATDTLSERLDVCKGDVRHSAISSSLRQDPIHDPSRVDRCAIEAPATLLSGDISNPYQQHGRSRGPVRRSMWTAIKTAAARLCDRGLRHRDDISGGIKDIKHTLIAP
jgi:hypothetical protein